MKRNGILKCAATVAMAGLLVAGSANAESSTKYTIYGFAMLDMGYDTGRVHPDWFDTMRPTKLGAYEGQYGEDGSWFAGVRQSRFGVKSHTPTSVGDLDTQFEFEMFGTGVDAGQTTIRLRHAYGQLGHFGAGQTWSPFMDIDVFPNSLEYWGPNGMAFFRNVQVRWMPIMGDTRMTIALERPGASGDPGDYADRIQELGDIAPRFPLPDLSAEYHRATSFGYVEVAGIVREIKWDDTDNSGPDLSGDVLGWGVNLSSNIRAGANNVLRLQGLYGEGVENYMNDAPVDVGAEATDDPNKPFDGKALPVFGLVAFLDHNWNPKWSTSLGYSRIDIDNTEGASSSAFKSGQYALVNLLHYPAPNVMVGAEVQYGKRDNEDNDFGQDDVKVQFSARYNFSMDFGGGN